MEDDRTLVAQTLAGDHQAFAELVTRHQGPVYNMAFHMLGESFEAEDTAQEVFLRAYRYLYRYDMERPFRTWLLAITSNYCIDRIRRRRMEWVSIEDLFSSHPALASKEPGPEEAAVRQERTSTLQNLLDLLPARYRTAMILHYWYDMPCAEIADMLGTCEGTIKSRLFRARRILAGQIAGSNTHAHVLVAEAA